MKTNNFVKQLAIGLGLSAAMVGSASAATMITSFDYTQEFEWVEPINPDGVVKEGATSGVSDVDGFTKLSWGTPSSSLTSNPLQLPSSLVINPTDGDSSTPSNVLTSGSGADALFVSTDVNATTFALGPVVTHNNFVITGDSVKLQDTAAQDYVVLTPAGGGTDQIQEVTFGVEFTETTNNPDNEDACPAGVPFNGLGCGDIFALTSDLLNLATAQLFNGTTLAFLIDSFSVDGFTYDVYVAALGLGPLSEGACDAAGAGDNCIGFTTAEGESSSFQLEFAILATENIPEPATLGLLAASLLLMGLVRRRKVNGSLSA
ncbi:MAG: hypothetical protein COB19_09055 [Porticoccus sp.]|nr:MAG: hypothetical protein COB19_09055 [Porticoccus sp.]